MLDVDEMRDAVEQSREITDYPCAREPRGTIKFVLNRDEIDDFRLFDQLDHLPKDHPVRIEIKIFRTKIFDDAVVMVIVYKNGSENGFLSVDIMRKSAFEALT